MTTFKANIEIVAPCGWTPADVAVALDELAAEYKLELDGVVAQIEGGREIDTREVAS
jgi:hypothetical protein